ncbi:MAG: phosphoribosylglycinamide formyltransferase [Bacteroidetes bacterium]|jgi:phosphoribosylglycinamide formyltransferase-1|nr:phosphoribosylglycinamide formyltransferase [Bacteroidota bacterium]
MKKAKLAIFASGSGTNAENIINFFTDVEKIETPLVITENAKAGVISRLTPSKADLHYIPISKINSPNYILPFLKERYAITHIVLAGYLKLIPAFLIANFQNRIINIHPALLPKYGGKGMYGARVHKAVKENNDRESGITIHLVNERFDEGKILFQKKVSLSKFDTETEIEKKVRRLEYQYYPKIIHKWCQDHINP